MKKATLVKLGLSFAGIQHLPHAAAVQVTVLQRQKMEKLKSLG